MGAPSAAALRRDIRKLADPDAAVFLQRFFKTGRGEYAHGDRFLGVRMPALRRLVRAYRTLPRQQVVEFLRSHWHEERMVALLILADQYRRANAVERDAIHRAYLA